MTKGSMQQKNIASTNIYASYIGAPNYAKQVLIDIKAEINGNTVVVGDTNTHLHQ